jgi:hypothetical protein
MELHNTIHPDPPLTLDAYDTATHERLVFQEITLPWACSGEFFFEPHPVRGFGRVWREWPGVRQRLGWALAPERAFTAALQPAMSEPRIGAGEVYIQMDNGRVMQMIGYYVGAGTWQFVTP